MKLQPDASSTPLIRAYGPGWIQVEAERMMHSIMLHSHRQPAISPWGSSRFENLQERDFHFPQLDDCELVLFGSGHRLRFIPPSWTVHLSTRRIGFETMDTLAACRTYNILSSEGRKVMALLLQEELC